MKRQDGRAFDELRPIKITTDFVKFAEGSCLIQCGDTMVLFGHTPTGFYGTPGEIFKPDSWCCIDPSDVSPTLLRLDDWKVFH